MHVGGEPGLGRGQAKEGPDPVRPGSGEHREGPRQMVPVPLLRDVLAQHDVERQFHGTVGVLVGLLGADFLSDVRRSLSRRASPEQLDGTWDGFPDVGGPTEQSLGRVHEEGRVVLQADLAGFRPDGADLQDTHLLAVVLQLRQRPLGVICLGKLFAHTKAGLPQRL